MQPDDDGRRQLTSWKEIAQFLGRSVRTVQDWEKREGLPVHRHRHQRKDSVYAYADEVEAWWRQHEASPPSPLPDTGRGGETPAPRRRPLLGAAAAVLMLLTNAPGARIEPRGSLGAAAIEIDGPPRGQLTYASIADLDGDERNDLLLNATEGREIYLILGGAPQGGRARATDISSVTIKTAKGSGLYLSQVGDFNGDTLDDLVVTVRLGEPEGYSGSGSSYILWGRRVWPASIVVPEQAGVTIAVRRAPDATMHGCLLGGDDDLNGDGISDIWLGAGEYGDGEMKSAGSVFVIYGRSEWPRALEAAAAADVTFRGSRMGEGLATPCVFNRDVGAPAGRVAILADEARLWELLGGAGRLYVFAPTGGWPRVVDGTTAQFQITGHPRARQAWNVESGDVNGDGLADIVGAINRTADGGHGGVRIWFGNRERTGAVDADSADVVILGASLGGGRLGQRLRLDDIDGDGVADVILAEPGRGQVHAVYGRPDWPRQGTLASFDAVTLMTGGADMSAWQLALGDLDTDLLPDLVVVSPMASDRAGRATIIKPYVPVRLEVRPIHDPNPIILPKGVCVARVYGWSAAAHDRLDPATLRLAGASPTRYLIGDFNHDGFEDVQLYVDTASMRVRHDTTRIAVRGRTLGGMPIGGTDAVVIVSGTEAERDQF